VKVSRFTGFGPPEVLVVREVAEPTCALDGVLVQVAAAAVNHLDVDERAGTSGFAINAEHQLGREGAGTVIEVGANTDPSWVGRRVIVSAYPPCGQCSACHSGLINVCQHPRRPGIEVPGTYAQVVAVPISGVFALPDEISFETAACLQLGFGTAWHAAFNRGELRPGQTVLVTGAGGGVGSALVQLGVLAGADVIAVAGSKERRALAAKLGATTTLESGPGLPEAVREITNGDGVDLVIDAAGGTFLHLGIACLRVGGRYVLYGAHGAEHVNLDLISLFRSYTSLIAYRGWLLKDMYQVIQAAASGRITVSVQEALPLEDAARAHRALADRNVVGKIVLCP
jgi:NADPH:quinone reductase-like Zn-dependent oxidoreductase